MNENWDFQSFLDNLNNEERERVLETIRLYHIYEQSWEDTEESE